MQKTILAAAALTALAALSTAPLRAAQQETVLNVYSARGDATDEAVYNDFMERTGLRVNRSENDGATTLEMLKNEATNPSADVVLLDGLAQLHDAASSRLLQPVRSDTLDQAVPERLRAAADDDDGTAWFGLAWRARVIVYDPDRVVANDVRSYEQLAEDGNRGRLCLAPATDPASQGLIAALLEHDGGEKTANWLQGVADNQASDAVAGSDTDRIRAVAAGQCAITLADHFHLTRLMRSDDAPDRDVAASVAVAFPNQDSWGTHVDVAGAAVARHAPHGRQALQFLEYLASEQGQNLYANSNDEWPVVEKYQFDNDGLDTLLGDDKTFKADDTPLSQIAAHLDEARELAEAAD